MSDHVTTSFLLSDNLTGLQVWARGSPQTLADLTSITCLDVACLKAACTGARPLPAQTELQLCCRGAWQVVLGPGHSPLWSPLPPSAFVRVR